MDDEQRCAACYLLEIEREGERLELKNPSGLDVKIRLCAEHMLALVFRLGIATGEFLNEVGKNSR